MSPVDVDALMNDYAAVSIPESVRADIAASYFFDRTTVELAEYGRIDPYASVRNEGARMAFKAFLARIDRARAGKAMQQAKAISETAENRDAEIN